VPESYLVLYLVTGAFAGTASGLLGVGGGLIIVPVLYFVFSAQGLPEQSLMHLALATSLATIIVTSISSTRAHHKRQAVLWPVVARLAPGILLGAWLGGMLAAHISSATLKPMFGIFELLVAVYMLSQYKPTRHSTQISSTRSGGGGLVIGAISALVGIGGGSLTVPFLLWHGVGMRSAVASSAAVGLPIAVSATLAYIFSGWQLRFVAQGVVEPTLGYVHLAAFASIIATSFVFAPLGAKLAHYLPETTLRRVFALFLCAIAFKLILS